MPARNYITTTLDAYQKTWGQSDDSRLDSRKEILIAEKFFDFVKKTPDCFLRENEEAHFTGSALVVDATLNKVLLTHHRKLNLWLQLGGHADGHHLLDEVAMTEAVEESGLKHLNFFSYELSMFGHHAARPLPFDLDCHVIPESSKTMSHLHYDVRYLVVAEGSEKPIISDESHDVRWFTLSEARQITSEMSMHRQFGKVDLIRQALHG